MPLDDRAGTCREHRDVGARDHQRDARASVALDKLGRRSEDARANAGRVRTAEHVVDDAPELVLGRAVRASARGRSARRRPCRGARRRASRRGSRRPAADSICTAINVCASASLHAGARGRGRTAMRAPDLRRGSPSAGRTAAPTTAAVCAAVWTRGTMTPAAPASRAYWIEVALSSLSRTSAGRPARSAPAMIVCTSAAPSGKCSASATSTSKPDDREDLAGRELRVRDEAGDQGVALLHPVGDPSAHACPSAQFVRGSSSEAAARASPNFSTIR